MTISLSNYSLQVILHCKSNISRAKFRVIKSNGDILAYGSCESDKLPIILTDFITSPKCFLRINDIRIIKDFINTLYKNTFYLSPIPIIRDCTKRGSSRKQCLYR